MAGILNDRYFWQGIEQTRAWCEWRLLAELFAQGLPVPQPVAAHVERNGLFYRADLMTMRIANASPLSAQLQEAALSAEIWHAIGRTIRYFHQANVFHADLNAHNILLDVNLQVYIIDFDKGRLIPDGNRAWCDANLQRLQRSLNKLKQQCREFHYGGDDWQSLLRGYLSVQE